MLARFCQRCTFLFVEAFKLVTLAECSKCDFLCGLLETCNENVCYLKKCLKGYIDENICRNVDKKFVVSFL